MNTSAEEFLFGLNEGAFWTEWVSWLVQFESLSRTQLFLAIRLEAISRCVIQMPACEHFDNFRGLKFKIYL